MMKPGGFFSPRKMALSFLFFIAIACATLLPTDAVEPSAMALPVNSAPNATAAATLVVVETTPLDYVLPYPGLLPDSPLYFLKVTRDKLMTLLIQNPTDRAFYLLFLSDKRLAAAKELLAKNDSLLAAQTFLSAEDYFTQAVTEAERGGESSSQTDLVAKLTVSSAKHKEILTNVKGSQTALVKARGDNLKSFDRVRKLLVEWELGS